MVVIYINFACICISLTFPFALIVRTMCFSFGSSEPALYVDGRHYCCCFSHFCSLTLPAKRSQNLLKCRLIHASLLYIFVHCVHLLLHCPTCLFLYHEIVSKKPLQYKHLHGSLRFLLKKTYYRVQLGMRMWPSGKVSISFHCSANTGL